MEPARPARCGSSLRGGFFLPEEAVFQGGHQVDHRRWCRRLPRGLMVNAFIFTTISCCNAS